MKMLTEVKEVINKVKISTERERERINNYQAEITGLKNNGIETYRVGFNSRRVKWNQETIVSKKSQSNTPRGAKRRKQVASYLF